MADHSDIPETAPGGSTVTVEDVTEAMKDVVDPELGINVVDLGLVYDLHLDEASNLVIDMTLTSAACPLTDVIQDQTNSARSEEHTSELQSLMRISYAVFCLKKNNYKI